MSRDSCCPIGCQIRHVLGIVCKVFCEPNWRLKVSFIIRPVCCCIKPQRYRRLHLPVKARAKNMFSTDVKRLCFRCQTLKVSPSQTRACVISNVYISGVKLWIFSAQTRSSLDRVSAVVVHCHRSLENMRKTCENHWYVAKFQSLIPETDVWGHVSLRLGGETSKFDT